MYKLIKLLTMKKTLLILAIALSTASYSQLTNANFQAAINDCLTLNPIDGLCIYGEYGVMPDLCFNMQVHLIKI